MSERFQYYSNRYTILNEKFILYRKNNNKIQKINKTNYTENEYNLLYDIINNKNTKFEYFFSNYFISFGIDFYDFSEKLLDDKNNLKILIDNPIYFFLIFNNLFDKNKIIDHPFAKYLNNSNINLKKLLCLNIVKKYNFENLIYQKLLYNLFIYGEHYGDPDNIIIKYKYKYEYYFKKLNLNQFHNLIYDYGIDLYKYKSFYYHLSYHFYFRSVKMYFWTEDDFEYFPKNILYFIFSKK